ncbi:CAP domain-containing protein [Arthrobacter zhaoxinii]|uniref:CAP domain-containing protein n=1 Tax=Arthrobacter zhaoxinii TaxID=2964616 RepID=A0ABY5YND1_9MICC|nr:CAP domain-containing protein [Arthrobacter zhaoxinii]UWX96595.1 CAP domain-containing protein [Arthrobacter zhaoxinii]
MRVRKPVSALAVALITVVSALVALPTASAATSEAQTAGRMFSLINNYRAESGLAPLAWNPQIGSVAQEWTAGSAVGAESAGAYTYGHNPTLPAGYPAGSQGWSENIVWNYDVDQAFYWWVNSGPHNMNMLNPSFTDVGIGAVRLTAGPNEGAYLITADFGRYPGSGGGQPVAPAPQPVVDDAAEKAKQEAAAREESERVAAEKAAAEKAAADNAAAEKAAAEKAEADRAAAEKAEADRAAAEKAEADRAAAEKAAAEKDAADKAGADTGAAEKAAAEKAEADKAAETAAAAKAEADRAAAEKAAAETVAAEKAAAETAAAAKAQADRAAAEKAAAEEAAAEKNQPIVEPAAPAETDAPVEVPAPVVDETVSEPAPAQLPTANVDEKAGEDAADAKPATDAAPVKAAPKAPAAIDQWNEANLTEANRGGFVATPRGSLLTLSGLEPNAAYRVVLHSNAIDLGTMTADSAGNLAVDVPADLPAGDHRVALTLGAEFVGWQSFSVEESVTVLGAAAGTETGLEADAPTAEVSAAMPAGVAGGELAATGLASWQLLTAVLGSLLVVAGTAAVVMAQRRTRQA